MNAITTVEQEGGNPIVRLNSELERRGQEIAKVLPSHIPMSKFQRTIITAAQQNPDLLQANGKSLILACMKAAQDGLLPDGREAALVVFKESYKEDGQWMSRKVVQYMPMVYGLRKKVLQSNEVTSLEVSVVYRAEVEAGKFLYEVGQVPPLRHRPMLELTAEQATDDQIVAAYSIATMKDGTKSYELMRRFEIDKVRECSQTGATKDRQGKARTPRGPWVDWFPEQAKKTVMRRHSKVLPMSGDLLIDVEGQELEQGASAAAVLGSQQEDAPELLEDRTAQAEREQEERDHNGGFTIAEEQAQEVEEQQEQPGPTPHPAEAKAEELVAAFKAAENIIDLETAWDEAKRHSNAMPDEIWAGIGAEYRAAEKKLKAVKK